MTAADLPSDVENGYRAERQLFDGDTGTFALALRQAIVRLLRGPYIDGVAEPRLWSTILDNRSAIADYFCEIFLILSLDPERKIAMLAPAEVDAVHTTAIQPRKPLRREETLLALRLRLLLDRHAGSGTDATISRAGAREILEEHRQPGSADDKRLEELTDASIHRLLSLRLLLPTELEGVYRVSSALAMALPFDHIDEIPPYLEALARSAGTLPADGDGGPDESGESDDDAGGTADGSDLMETGPMAVAEEEDDDL
ncbi:DUF4194 domain-containing protein [Arthrobacter mangrovi]|uniref:DUF4194 domain-containing protein n=1 Tax=Arthrobacter mangrovi TaxID=2966350 RepID=A0ABQ5MUS7_9MICC|nr:DUF4194 domain-containing protein [Arthrobacter mangrovi]GLB67728.1 hypothetical protein AHIS1636_21680 [Arthrobacter mangrovi]